jgi:hypothetical protein
VYKTDEHELTEMSNGFGADLAADNITRTQCAAELKYLRSLLKSARASGDKSETMRVQARLKKLNHAIKDYYLPGGGRKRLSQGNVLDKIAAAARARKRRAVEVLTEAGLIQIAEHIQTFYTIQPRTFGYCPTYKPHWLTEKNSRTPVQSKNSEIIELRESLRQLPPCQPARTGQ